MEDDTSFLGTGWAFPPSFEPRGKKNKMVSAEDDIAESIRIIINTIPGERIMRPTFGCDLRKLLFDSSDLRLISNANEIIGNALLNFEPRVKFIKCEVFKKEEEDGLLKIMVYYSIIATNTRHNIVFPFYIKEGTNISAIDRI